MTDLLRDAILRVYNQDPQNFTAERLLKAAEDPDEVVLRAEFIWDDAKAARLQRLDRARQLVRMVRIEVEPDREMRAFVSIVTEVNPHRVYRHIDDLRHNQYEVRQALSTMEADWRIFRRKWEAYAGFWEMVAEDQPEDPQ